LLVCLLRATHPLRPTLFPYTTLFRSLREFQPPPVGHRRLIDLRVGVRPAEDFQEVEPALALGAGEEGEELVPDLRAGPIVPLVRSEEHTSELQSRSDLVCRLLLEKKK